jgi:hypothetical protein
MSRGARFLKMHDMMPYTTTQKRFLQRQLADLMLKRRALLAVDHKVMAVDAEELG